VRWTKPLASWVVTMARSGVTFTNTWSGWSAAPKNMAGVNGRSVRAHSRCFSAWSFTSVAVP